MAVCSMSFLLYSHASLTNYLANLWDLRCSAMVSETNTRSFGQAKGVKVSRSDEDLKHDVLRL